MTMKPPMKMARARTKARKMPRKLPGSFFFFFLRGLPFLFPEEPLFLELLPEELPVEGLWPEREAVFLEAAE